MAADLIDQQSARQSVSLFGCWPLCKEIRNFCITLRTGSSHASCFQLVFLHTLCLGRVRVWNTTEVFIYLGRGVWNVHLRNPINKASQWWCIIWPTCFFFGRGRWFFCWTKLPTSPPFHALCWLRFHRCINICWIEIQKPAQARALLMWGACCWCEARAPSALADVRRLCQSHITGLLGRWNIRPVLNHPRVHHVVDQRQMELMRLASEVGFL